MSGAVLKITSVDAATQIDSLFFSATKLSVFHLTPLASVGPLRSSLGTGEGKYSQVGGTLDERVRLVSLDGNTTGEASSKGNGQATVIPVRVYFVTAA